MSVGALTEWQQVFERRLIDKHHFRIVEWRPWFTGDFTTYAIQKGGCVSDALIVGGSDIRMGRAGAAIFADRAEAMWRNKCKRRAVVK